MIFHLFFLIFSADCDIILYNRKFRQEKVQLFCVMKGKGDLAMSFIGGIALFVVIYVIIVVVARRNMNHNYTIGSGMFKMSDDNLQKGEHLDSADYNYYDNKGVLK